ncbi:MAG TPA: MaoC family dehydratase [Myxococcaceae bacterium]|nr:MaoC family dehydratase [Myxococcaceae bacterium]
MRYWEDFQAGQVEELGSKVITREEIIAFAREFDPQPFHLDEEEAKRTYFGGLVASGWHTCAIAMRLLVDSWKGQVASLGSPGMDELRWVKPVRPGDTLFLRTTVLETAASRSKPDRGSIRVQHEMRNQHGDVVMTMKGWGMMARRPAGEAP